MFLERFPTLMALSQASTAGVCQDMYGGQLPAAIAELEQLPGIGRYTARAVACFGFGVHTEQGG